jgi:hypothetical protein
LRSRSDIEPNVPGSKWGGNHCSRRIRLQKSEGERLAVNPSDSWLDPMA